MAISGGNQLIDSQFVFEKIGLTQGMKIADLGCGGAGHFVIPAAKIVGNTGRVYAADILKSALASIEARGRSESLNNIITVWTNLEIPGATKIPANSLDRSMVINLLFQTQKHREVLQEASRLLKKGGQLLVIDWKMIDAPFGPPPTIRIQEKTIQSYTKELGLKEIMSFDAGKYHFGLVFEK